MSSDTTFLTFNPDHNPLLHFALRDGVNRPALLALAALFLVGLTVASFTDVFRGRQTPGWFNHATLVVGAAVAPFVFENWTTHYAIAAAVLVVVGLGWWFAGIGMGDVKLYTAMALLFGWPALFMLGVAHVAAAAVSVPVSVARRSRKMPVPMFPFAAIGVVVTLPAIGAPVWLSWAGVGGLAAAGAYGLWERRFRPLPTVADMAAPLAAGADVVRIRPGERPLVPDGADGWRPVADVRPVAGGAIDLAVDRLLDRDTWKAFDSTGEVRVRADDVQVTVTEILGGYTLTLTRA